MAVTDLGAWTQAAVTALSTDLNTLANNTASAVSAAQDNGTNLDLVTDFELVLGTQTARSAGATVALYISYSLDGINYMDAVIDTDNPVAVFPLDAATTARRVGVRGVDLTPGLWKAWLVNRTGQAFNATGNTLRYRTRSITTT